MPKPPHRPTASGERPPRPLTRAYLQRAALHYLDRYASSAENLRRILANKARKRLAPEGITETEVAAMIEDVVAGAVRGGFVDDRMFADSRAGTLARRGTSPRMMRLKLKAAGIGEGLAAETADQHGQDELALARRHAERKRLGPWRPRPDPARRERDLASLCRAGFPYRIAVAALDPEAE